MTRKSSVNSTILGLLAAALMFVAPQTAAAADDGHRRGRRYSSYSRGYDYPERSYARERSVYRSSGYRRERSTGKSVAIVGGSTAAGAALGAIAGGGKGAALGAVIGGVGGFIYDRNTKDRRRW